MLNLLKFRAKAQYSDGRETDLTGEQAFDIYIETMRKIVERGGGKFLFDSAVKYLTIGEVEGLWTERARSISFGGAIPEDYVLPRGCRDPDASFSGP